MANVLLFHHAHGLTRGVKQFADLLRNAGHTVHTPDLFEGRVFGALADGLVHAQRIGFATLLERGQKAADAVAGPTVYAGWSLGVLPAQMLAQTRSSARAALFISACVPVTEFGAAWPAHVPLQVHGMEQDDIFANEGDLAAAREITASRDVASLFLYPGTGHLFADATLPDHDPRAAALLLERVRTFLARLSHVA